MIRPPDLLPPTVSARPVPAAATRPVDATADLTVLDVVLPSDGWVDEDLQRLATGRAVDRVGVLVDFPTGPVPVRAALGASSG